MVRASAFVENFNPISNGLDQKNQSSFLELNLRSTTVTCEPLYGFLPCTTELWGQLFLIVVYEYLLALGQKYVSAGSDLFFKMFGTGIFGASLFHILGTIPPVAILLVNGISGSTETAEELASMGIGMLAGAAVMSLTLIWGSCVAFGSYDLSKTDTTSTLENKKQFSLTGFGVTTDAETRYTARIMLLSMIPFLILQLPKILNSSSATQVAVLVSLIITLVFLFVYCFYQKTTGEEHQTLVAQKKKTQSTTATTDKSWLNYIEAAFLLILGTGISLLLAQPLMEALQDFSSAANIPSFFVSYILIPLAMSYQQALSAISSARKKTKRAASLTFSERGRTLTSQAKG
ncbi:hypothetical protein L1049_010119 [Liquidambar formosana]|uniref:Sodium/calcium exchanger membrane region domain-containing protein n=1 Tax=Liquidambar formosana TaxID=63359 RepID=A0AAP0R1I6_LIQFO